LLVDPHKVDDGPSSNQGSRDNDQDARAEEASTVGNIILANPRHKDSSTSISGNVKDDIHEGVPPLNLIVEHQEELLRDLPGDQDDSKDGDECHSSLQRNEEAAYLILGY
jgi:hypothetical protein